MYLTFFSLSFSFILWSAGTVLLLLSLLLLLFFSRSQLVVIHWGLSNSKSSQVSRSLISVRADLNNAVVCMVLILPLITNFACPFSITLVIVPRAPKIIDITVTFTNFSSLWQDPNIWLSLAFISFSHNSLLERLDLLNDKLFFCC